MNKIIKFRAWDTRTNKWYFSVNSPFEWSDWNIPEKGNQVVTTMTIPEGVILQQFTGLKDKNGTEIYEGDIVRFSGGNSIQTLGENSDIRVVSVLEDTQQLGWKGSGYTFCEKNCRKLVEVIGNIYENPELIEEKN